MSDGGKSRKIGRNKRSPSMVAYKAQDRCSRNKKRNIKKETDLQTKNIAERPIREAKSWRNQGKPRASGWGY